MPSFFQKTIKREIQFKGGHQLTNAFLKEFLSDSKYFSVVEFKEKKLPNSSFYSRPVAASA